MRYNELKKATTSSNYKHVYKYLCPKGVVYWKASVGITNSLRSITKRKVFKADQEREAAKWIDMRLIEAGKDPVNILTKKIC